MILRKVLIESKKLKSIPESERIFFVQLGIFLNELLILHKLLHFSNNYDSDNKVLQKAQNAQSLFIARILAEKLFEGWRLLQENFWGSKLSKQYKDLLTDEGKDSLDKLKSYFSRDNLIKKIRNYFATHYYTSSDGLRQQIRRIPDTETFELYFGREEGNCLYHLSHVFITLAILEAVDISDIKNAMMTFFSNLFQVADWFIGFSQDLIMQFVIKNFREIREKVEIPDPPNFRDIKIPYFVKET